MIARIVPVMIWLLYPKSAYAYLDPATGSILMGMLSAVISTIVILWERLVRILHLLVQRPHISHRSTREELLIHCESPTYLPLFEPLVDELDRANVSFSLICTTQREAEVFEKYKNARIILAKPDRIFRQILRSKARVFLSTTPGIDVLELKKSAAFKTSCHLIHAPADIHTYAPFSFDQYDVVMCCGDFQTRSIRRLESLRGRLGSRRKKLLTTGLLYYDGFIKRNVSAHSPQDRLLVAPTWGKSSLIYHIHRPTLEALSRNFSRVLIRFHPQSKTRDSLQVQKIKELARSFPNVEFDQSPSSFEAIIQADAMLTDISGIIIDFKILKPWGRLFFTTPYYHFADKEGHWLKWDPYEVTFARKYGVELPNLNASESLADLKALKAPCQEPVIGDFDIANIGQSAKPTANGLIQLMMRNP